MSETTPAAEGWHRPTGSYEWHYFRGWRSLCSLAAITTATTFAATRVSPQYQPNCPTCQQMLGPATGGTEPAVSSATGDNTPQDAS